MRCRACRRHGLSYRFTLPRAPHHYKRPVRCPRCKGTDVADYEATYLKSQVNRLAKRPLCYCLGVPHPHGKGSHVLCRSAGMHLLSQWRNEDLQAYERDLWDNFGRKIRRTATQ